MGVRGACAVVGVLAVVGLLAACAREVAPLPTPGPVKPTVTEVDDLEARIRGVAAGEPDPRPRLAEEGLARCMAEAGFTYEPQAAAEPIPSAPLVLTREHAESHGYGDTLPSAPGADPRRWASRGPQPGDANARHRDALDAAQLDTYWEAMDGTDGCQARVMGSVFADVVTPTALHDVEGALRALHRRVESEPRVTAAVERWTECMADAGFPGLVDRHGGADLVADRAADFPAPEDLTFAEIGESFAGELAELQAFELEVALTDVTCLEQAGFYAAWDEARTELHATFLDTYAADLEAWATWAEEARAGVS